MTQCNLSPVCLGFGPDVDYNPCEYCHLGVDDTPAPIADDVADYPHCSGGYIRRFNGWPAHNICPAADKLDGLAQCFFAVRWDCCHPECRTISLGFPTCPAIR